MTATAIRVARDDTRPPRGRRRLEPTYAPRSFRPDVEGLRALAVLLVVLYHAHVPGIGGGYVGVSVFFVISGFLITSHLARELERTGSIRLLRFYARRARRLLPAAATVLIATTIASWVLVSGLYAEEVGQDALWAAVFSANLHFALEGVDYQAGTDPSVFQHYWSLSLEEQFYLAWPLLLLAVAALARKRPRARTGLVAAVVAVVALASFALSQVLAESSPTIAYFLTPARAWELALGGLVAIGAGWLVKRTLLQNGIVATIGLAMVIAAGVLFTDATPYPSTAALLPTVGTALVIAAGLRGSTFAERRGLSWKPFQVIGKLSYGLYLWHWPVLILAPLVLGRDLSPFDNVILCVLAFVLAIFSFVAIEEPFRTAPGLQVKSWRNFVLAAITIVATLSVAASAIVIGPLRYRSGEAVAAADRDAIVEAVLASAELERVPGNLDPSLADAAKDKPELDAADGISCMVNLLATEVSAEPGGSCVAGGTEFGSRTVVLIGDSHAYHWMPALREVAIERGWRLISMTKGGCAYWDVELVNLNLKRDYTECYQWRENVTTRIAAERPDLIVTTAAVFNPRGGDFTDRWVEGVTSATTRLVSFGAPVYVIEDTPYPRTDIPKCLAQHTDDAWACAPPPEEAYTDNDRRVRSAEAARAAGAVTIDPGRWFCSPERCPAFVGNTVVYTDISHISQTYSRMLGTVLGTQLPREIGGGVSSPVSAP